MQLDWDKAINDILSEKMTCQACGAMGDQMIVGYTREAAAAEFATRCKECTDKSDCDARKLVVVCEPCARQYRVNGELMDEAGMMSVLIDECRRNLEDSIDYLATYWKEEIEVEYDDMAKGLDQVDPELFKEEDSWRMRVEGVDLEPHRGVREDHLPLPDPGWRSTYVEEVVGLGYTTLLGD